MARVRPPVSLTLPIPGNDSRSSFNTLRASSVVSRGSRRPETATVSTGEDSRSKRSIMGVSVPSGNWPRMVRTLPSTSWLAWAPFFSMTNWMMIWVNPSRVVERSSSIPETVLQISSSGLVTPLSISSTEAPRSTALTTTTGTSTLGNRSTPRRLNPARPMTSGAVRSMAVNTGRRMQISQIAILRPTICSWPFMAFMIPPGAARGSCLPGGPDR